MIDIKQLRNNPDIYKDNARKKGVEVDVDQLLGFDKELQELRSQVDEKRRQINEHADNFKQTQGTTSPENNEKGRALKKEKGDLEHKLKSVQLQFDELIKKVPNLRWQDVPDGTSEADNINSAPVIQPRTFDFEPKNHWQIAQQRMWIDKERAAKVSGSRFAYIKGDLVKLQLAIVQFTMNVLSNEEVLKKIIKDNSLSIDSTPFTPVLPPLMLKEFVYDEMDRLEPRDDRYQVGEEKDHLWLQGSAEHVVGSMHRQEKFNEADLPIRYIAYATSFRREAGTYGKDTEGIFRMHQFDKLEMEVLSVQESGIEEHKFLIAIQEYLMQQLDLPYRVVTKCAADIGKPNARGIDIEAWLPGQDKYRETHTADYMTDYQARRLKTRVRRSTENDSKVELVHTNDATAFALGRTMIAIIENYQTANGGVRIPEVLRPYMGNREVL